MRWISRQFAAHTGARFIAAGILNTAFGFLVYGATVFAGAPVWAALLTSVLSGIVFNYVTIGGYAFRQLSRKTFPRFVGCYVLVYATNLALIELLARSGLGAVGAQAVLTLPMAGLSYLLMRHVAFRAS
jgi:putative flippase GtrA